MNQLLSAIERPEPTVAAVVASELTDDQIGYMQNIGCIAEVRADLLPSLEAAYVGEQIKRLGSIPVLLTARHASEGGKWPEGKTEYERLGFMSYFFDMVGGVDIELSAPICEEVVEWAQFAGKIAIVSKHDFKTTPTMGELEDTLSLALDAGADFTKIATRADTPEEYDRLAEFTESYRAADLIVVAMGKYGPQSRIELSGKGSHLTYAFTGDSVAPGQLGLEETHNSLLSTYPDYAALHQ